MGGGILPIARKDGYYYVLMARESLDIKWRDAGKWSDFGGSREGSESQYDTALREGTEETAGLFGNIQDIELLMKYNCIDRITIPNYSTYLIETDFNTMLPYWFNKKYRYILKTKPNLVHERNGLYEKDKLRWIKVNNLMPFMKHVRFWFKPLLLKIYNKYKN